MDDGAPVSYMVLQEGTPVRSADGQTVGTVVRVLAAEAEDIFDGIVVEVDGRARFADADQVEAIYERAVVLTVDAAGAAALPEPDANPVVIEVEPADVGPDRPEDGPGGAARRVWDRLTGDR